MSKRTEIIAGITTFFTMSYIVVVNPAILAAPGTGMPFEGVLSATVLLCFFLTLFMGLYAKLPYAVAPGMGINAFFAYTVIIADRVPWPVALGMVFWAGVLFVVISVTGLRVALAQAIPKDLRIASSVGIGIFLSFIGLRNAGLVIGNPVTLVGSGHLGLRPLLSLSGVAITVFLAQKKNPFAFLAGIFFITVAAWWLGLVHSPTHFFSRPDLTSVFFKLDPLKALRLAFLPTILSILFTDLFDSISTFIGVSEASRLLDEKGEPLRLREGLIVDAFATLAGGLLGTSSGTAYLESSAGIEMGGRTGLTSVVTAFCFLPLLFVAPLASMVPEYATAPVLMVVGALMFRGASRLRLERLEDAIPVFLTIVLIPFTFSITEGLLWGFVSRGVLYPLAGRRRELTPVLYGLAILGACLLWLEHG